MTVHIPLSQRRACYNAMRTVKAPPENDQRWLELEAALDALQPFLHQLLDNPQSALVKPTHNSDSLMQHNS